ncbi:MULTISPECIES: LOG family protein [Microbacterium]|jgi:predicted Rossmann-fold nucleotide-binding protein|uniref:LOG family protein n=1 Tax=Microbacterium TaxID=33882 RepID=UPI001E386421|nr:Rossmann fold nucleotide-binding protein [Microbacterium nymphoidis]MCD2496804.1 Rossmann fold nucleotide-binding protein [Microbacterium nymphoidis]
MTRHVRRIDSLPAFDAEFTDVAGRPSLRGSVIESLDLRERSEELLSAAVSGAVFLGCLLTDEVDERLRGAGALVFPRIPHVPFDPYRGELYTADELYGTDGYAASLDGMVYAWSRTHTPHSTVSASLAVALHDHSVSAALDEELAGNARGSVVGVMGGHGVHRGDHQYRAAAGLGRDLTRRGCTVLTGGGPGAMEAANLGAYLAGEDDDALDTAIAVLAEAPDFSADIDGWVRTAREVRRRWPGGTRSIGIPTWFYGHEPPGQFATAIAKYFANPIREATLLARCDGGIVFLPGAAGTVSEIFADACENYYADERDVAPMVLVGHQQWTRDVPAWQLLRSLGAGRTLGERIHLVDSALDAPAALGLT